MNVETSKINQLAETKTSKSIAKSEDSEIKFADELKEIVNESQNSELQTKEIGGQNLQSMSKEATVLSVTLNDVQKSELQLKENNVQNVQQISNEADNLNKHFEQNKVNLSNKYFVPNEDFVNNVAVQTAVNDVLTNKPLNKTLDNAIEGLNSIVEEFNQTDEKLDSSLKTTEVLDDGNNVINNDFNIQENKDLLPQMNPNMNFSGNGQPFSSFMNNKEEETSQNPNVVLGNSAQDLAEEAAILSTMAENIAIANKNQMLKGTEVVVNEEGIKRVDSRTGIKIENIVKYDSIIMNQADVEIFVNLVENQEVDLNNLAPRAAEKSVQVSKTLADMLAKSMENNQPLRIDFDNNVSVIIRISRDGKITADFLPSSQIAEAYLKENLPLLRQRFDDNNIEYDSLNQKERRENNKENNRKKGRNNE